MIFWPTIHGILTLPNHGILNPQPWYFDPLFMVFWSTAYLLIINKGVKVPWGFNFPYMNGQFLIRGVNIPGMKIDPWVKIPLGQHTIWHWQRRQLVSLALMKQDSIARCSGNLTYWNTSYDKDDHLAVRKSFISSLNILFNKEHDDHSCVYWITKLHKNPYGENNTTGASTFSTN